MMIGDPAFEPLDFILVAESDLAEILAGAGKLLFALRKNGYSAELVREGSTKKRYLKAQNKNPKAILVVKGLQADGVLIDIKRGWGSGEIDPLDHEVSVAESLASRFNVDRLPPNSQAGADILVRPGN